MGRSGRRRRARAAADKFARSEVVVTGKVTAIEKDPASATAPYAGAKDEVAYRVAVVKIDSALAGGVGLTHIKVGFVPPDPNAPPARGSGGVIRPREPVPELKEGQTVLLYLNKHPTADFHVMPSRKLPADLTTDDGKRELDCAKAFAAVLADPMKGLKSDKATERAETAAFLVVKYGAYPEFGAADTAPLDAAESALVLKALAGVPWNDNRSAASTSAWQAFCRLGLTEKDGWKAPAGRPGEDYPATAHKAFVRWVDGPGKDYRIQKVVPKK